MSETDFQELFVSYEKSPESLKKRQNLIRALHLYVYEFPKRRFHADDDRTIEFYMQTASSIETLLDEYNPSYGIAFDVYFLVKLKRRYLNFLARKHKEKMRENMNDFYEISHELRHESVFDHSADYSPAQAIGEEVINTVLENLEPEEETVIRLYYGFPLRLTNFRLLQKRHGNRKFLKTFREYRKGLERRRSEEKREKEKVFQKIHYLNFDTQKKEQEGYAANKEKLIGRFYSVRRGEPLRIVAELMNSSITYVHRRLKRGLKNIETILQKKYSKFINKSTG